MPAGPAGSLVSEFIATVNSDDWGRYRDFVRRRFSRALRDQAPLERHLQTLAHYHDVSQGFDFHGIRTFRESRPPNETIVLVRNRLTGAWQCFVLTIGTRPPHALESVSLLAASPPFDSTRPRYLTDSEIADRVGSLCQRLADAGRFSGAVLLAKDGKVLFQRAYGLAHRSYGVHNQVGTRFNLASMNEMFTGVAVLQLAQAGRLCLDDHVDKYIAGGWTLPGAPGKITIVHLLDRASGLGAGRIAETGATSTAGPPHQSSAPGALSVKQKLALGPGAGQPGADSELLLLRAIVEKVSGLDWRDYVRERICEPAGMTDTDCYALGKPVPDVALGYTRNLTPDGPIWAASLFEGIVARGQAADGGYSTVRDLLRFGRALESHRLLDPRHTEMALSIMPRLDASGPIPGSRAEGRAEARVVGLADEFAGGSLSLALFLDSGYTAVVLSNCDGGADAVRTRMRDLIAPKGT
jgi:CubicO group peptidase (beta-lactamase class C family)